jgi:flavoprotein
MPDEPDELPPADAVVVAPATFNTVNKWAAGITDTLATGLLCELTGLGVPIVAVPLVKEALARHVAFGRSREVLNEMGVRVLFDPQAPAVTHAKLANGAGGTAHCYRIQTRQEGLTWIARHAGSGLRGHAAAVACPKRRSRG